LSSMMVKVVAEKEKVVRFDGKGGGDGGASSG
jgi:hypothetical protein